MPATIRIQVTGLKELQAAIKKFPQLSAKYLGYAGQEAADKVILSTVGLKKYPPDTARAPQAQYWTAKQRRYFFWALREGLIEVPYRRGQSPGTEDYQQQFYTKQLRGGLQTEIGNRASYAYLLGGEKQSQYQKARGWRRLTDVVDEKMSKITDTYQRWVDKLLRDIKLK